MRVGGRDEAYEIFIERVEQDTLDLAEALGFGAVHRPWLIERPARQVSDYEFLYGDPDGDWVVRRFNPEAGTFGPVEVSRRREWRDREAFQEKVEGHRRAAERWGDRQREDLIAFYRHWQELAEDRFEVPGGGAALGMGIDEEWLTACALAPDLVDVYMEAQTVSALKQVDAMADAGVKVIWGGSDLANNHGPMTGPAFFHEHVFPRYAGIATRAHERGMYYLFRSDGNLWSIADDLFDSAAIDAYGEIDHEAGMRIPELQARYPNLTCWGNVACSTLRSGTPDDVRREVDVLMAQALPTGRWILGSSNTVMVKTPVENVMAMYDASR